MPRYIDADKLLRDIEKYHLSDGKFQHWVEAQPTVNAQKEIDYWYDRANSYERTIVKLSNALADARENVRGEWIKDNITGEVRKYGTNRHDALRISDDGRYLVYENLQNGDGSEYGDYKFVTENGKIPQEDEAYLRYGEDAYFNIGG